MNGRGVEKVEIFLAQKMVICIAAGCARFYISQNFGNRNQSSAGNSQSSQNVSAFRIEFKLLLFFWLHGGFLFSGDMEKNSWANQMKT